MFSAFSNHSFWNNWGPTFLLLPRHLVRSHDLALARSGAAPLFARAVP